MESKVDRDYEVSGYITIAIGIRDSEEIDLAEW